MGVKITVVGTSVMRAIPDDHIPNSARTGVANALLSAEHVNLVDAIQDSLSSSIGIKAEQMYSFAEQGKYIYGLPSGDFDLGEKSDDIIRDVLGMVEGAPVTLYYCMYGFPNDLHVGWLKLISEHGYDSATNQLANLSAQKGTPVYLQDMVVVVPTAQYDTIDPKTLLQYGFAPQSGYTPVRATMTPASRQLMKPSPIVSDPDATTEHLLVTYTWQTVAGMQTDTFEVSLDGYFADSKYYQAMYTVGVGSPAKYFMYQAGTGVYPELDDLARPNHKEGGSFFPFTYFRFNKTSEISDKSSESYQASKKMVKLLGMNYDTIAEGIEASPELPNIEQAMLMMAVPAVTTNELERRYLFQFFNNVYNSPQYDDDAFIALTDDLVITQQKVKPKLSDPTSIVIQDHRFKITVDFGRIFKRRKAGSLGPVGTYDSALTQTADSINAIDATTGLPSTLPNYGTFHIYRHQISTGFYDEIVVWNLATTFWILGNFRQSQGTDDSPILIIPIDRSITQAYPIPVREQLYSRSLVYVINAVEKKSLKWYQTEGFQLTIIVIAVILTVESMGEDFTAIGAALAAGAYGVAAYLVIQMVLTYLIEYIAFKTAVRVLGVRFALVLAIIAAVAGMAGEMDGVTTGATTAPWASDLLQVANGLTAAINKQMQHDMADLLGQQHDLLETESKQMELLQSGQSLLDANIHIEPFVIFGESPEDYYNRTSHSGNIGVLAIDAVTYYVDSALTLPTLQQTLGGIKHV